MTINYYFKRSIHVDLVIMIKPPSMGIVNNNNCNSLAPYLTHNRKYLISMEKLVFTHAQVGGRLEIMKPCDFMMRRHYFLRYSLSWPSGGELILLKERSQVQIPLGGRVYMPRL